MRAKSYTSNYFKIYLLGGLVFVFRFLSMFIVIPFLSGEPSIYSISAICISLSIFLNYADMGFLKATKKYAAE